MNMRKYSRFVAENDKKQAIRRNGMTRTEEQNHVENNEILFG